ncbi:MAG: hypothetical protein R3Y46_05545, partial [Opitutales bacterium]
MKKKLNVVKTLSLTKQIMKKKLNVVKTLSLLSLLCGAIPTLNADDSPTIINGQLKGLDGEVYSNYKASDSGFSNLYLKGGSTLKDSDFSNTTFNSTQLLIYANYISSDASASLANDTATIENVTFSGSTANISSDTYSRTAFWIGYYSSQDMHAYLNNVDFSDMTINAYTGLDGGYTGLLFSYSSTFENISFNNLTYTSTSASAGTAYAFWLSSVKLIDVDFRDMTINLDTNADVLVNIGISGNSSNWASLSDVDFRGATFNGELMGLDDFYLSGSGTKAELNNVVLGDGTLYSAGEFRWGELELNGETAFCLRINDSNDSVAYYVLENARGDNLYYLSSNYYTYDADSDSYTLYTGEDTADYSMVAIDLASMNQGIILDDAD